MILAERAARMAAEAKAAEASAVRQGLTLEIERLRLERGRFLWPSPADGAVTITPAQLGYLLEGIDWRMPQKTWRPTVAG